MSERYLPIRVTQDIAIQQVGDETLLYDERRHMAFCLNRIAAAVWNHCDGSHDPAQIANKLTLLLTHPVSTEIVEFALAQLRKDGLLQETIAALHPAEFAGISRRSLMARAGAGAIMLLPVVAAVMAPRAAQAYNGCADCTPGDRGIDSPSGFSGPDSPSEPSSHDDSSLFRDDPQ